MYLHSLNFIAIIQTDSIGQMLANFPWVEFLGSHDFNRGTEICGW